MAKKKIFISYSRADSDYVARLVDALRNKGFDVWFDKNIRTGNEWDNTIEREIKNADAMVLILSDTSVQSDNVKDEMSYAMQLSKNVIPIKIEECDVPMRLARKQFIDFTQTGLDKGVNRLVDDISHALEMPPPKISTASPAQKPMDSTASEAPPKEPVHAPATTAAPAKSSGSNKALMYVIIAAVVALAVWGIYSVTSGGGHDMDKMAMCKADWGEMESALEAEEEVNELAALRRHIELYAPCPHENEAMDRISFLKAIGGDSNSVITENTEEVTDNSTSNEVSSSMGGGESSANLNENSGTQNIVDTLETPIENVEEVVEEIEMNEIDANTVAQVRYEGGYIMEKVNKSWLEKNEDGERLWTVEKRDSEAIYLRDGEARLKIDIPSLAIFYSDANTEPFQLYSITEITY
jgi:hypothetical protein